MDNFFDVDKFNIIEDEENYYFFRALNMADNQDLETGVILDKNGNFSRIRTDRERYEESSDETPKYAKDDPISLEQVYDHIKMHYRKDTNCISLSSNSNVSISYGRGSYKDQYVMVKVPKKELGEQVINAGQYMLEEIEKKVNEYISSKNLDSKITETLSEIENSTTAEEIREAIETRYTSQTLDSSKAKMKKGITYRSPVARVSSYQALNEEQTLEKNKIIAKLTLLERVGGMPPLIPHTATNNSLVQTVGNAFSSLELIHYGDIEAKEIIDVSKEVVDIFALLQQVEGQDGQIVTDLKREIIQFANQGRSIEIPEGSNLLRNYKVRKDISIDEMYELTGGKVEYGMANSIVKNMFYLAKSQSNAKELAKILNQITGNNPKYREVIQYIFGNGLRVEPEIITRQSNKGVRLSESISLDLRGEETGLIDKIKALSEEEQIEILENGGISDVRSIMSNIFSKVQIKDKIKKQEYDAEAVFSQYDWTKIGIEEFTIKERNNLLQRMQNEYCTEVYKKIEEQGIARSYIPTILFNIISTKRDFEVTSKDTQESIKQKRLKQYDRLIKEDLLNLAQDVSIERLERFLGYYDVKDTKIQLRPYQQRAVEKTDEIFENERFASVILPTGAGKSFVALSQLMEHQNEEILYLAPQNEILEQMKDYIIKYIHGPVNTIGRNKDDIITDVFPNLKFSTYPGLLAKDGEETINKQYGFVVLDELHRTGAKEWGSRLDTLIDNQPENTKVLGITATPRRDVDGINMANQMAEKLGYTNREATSGKHVAMNMSLTNAIRMGLVVNPKLVSCAYSLKEDGSLDGLKEKIDQIEDVQDRNEKLEKYESLRRNVENAEGISEILKANVKKGGKYIVFLPIVDELEDEDGNVIGRKKGKDKIQDYEKQIAEYFEGSDITPNFHSMLGEYGDKDNERRLEEFQNRDTDDTEFMMVMNKANEGLHLDKLDGMIWLRPMDENSRILYLQQLGRVIYSEDPDRPTKDEDRPVVIDLVNNTLKVNWDNEITEQDDIELLTIISDWTEKHDGTLPDINSTDKEEAGYAIVLKEIQTKYKGYLENEYDGLNEKQIEDLQEILRIGSLIDLWNAELPDRIVKEGEKQKNRSFKNKDAGPFQVNGLIKDFVELENEVDGIDARSTIEKFIEKLEKLQGLGVDVSKIAGGDTIETLAKKSKIAISKEQAEELELNLDDKIGYSKRNIAQAYRGKGSCIPPTEEQVKRLLELGISLELIKRDAKQEFIEKLEKLQGLGVDVSKIAGGDTIETLAQKSEIAISMEQAEELELNLDEKIGKQKNRVEQAYRGNGNWTPPTEEQVKRLLELGISLELIKRDATQEFIEKLEKLQRLGVNVSKITTGDTMETLAKKSEIVISREQAEELELNLDDKIGSSKNRIAQAYRGNGSYTPPTEEQVKRLLELGISLELTRKDVTLVEGFIENLEKLQRLGVDVSKIAKGDTIETLAQKSEIAISREQAEELGLKLDDKIGSSRNCIVKAYRGKGCYIPPTEEQVKRILKLGISLEKRDKTKEFIEKLEKLQVLGVDISKMVNKDTIETLAKKSEIVISREQADELELKLDDKIGLSKSNIAQAYRGKGCGTPPTEEQVKKLLELGLSLETKLRTSKELAEASISSLTDIEMADKEDQALKELVEKIKEGENKQNEQSY